MIPINATLTHEEVLNRAQTMLQTAKRGLADIESSDPSRRQPGIYNLVVFGRAVTFVLQNLRTVDRDRFNEWYAPREKAMREDPLLRYFHLLRTKIEKEGIAETSTSTYIKSLNTDDLQPLLSNPPPGAKGFFIGDQVGGSGWEIEMPDGAIEKFYVALPPHVEANIQTKLHLPDAPTEHQGQHLSDTSVPTLGRAYIVYLDGLLRDARAAFLKGS